MAIGVANIHGEDLPALHSILEEGESVQFTGVNSRKYAFFGVGLSVVLILMIPILFQNDTDRAIAVLAILPICILAQVASCIYTSIVPTTRFLVTDRRVIIFRVKSDILQIVRDISLADVLNVEPSGRTIRLTLRSPLISERGKASNVVTLSGIKSSDAVASCLSQFGRHLVE